jgi:imidazole glycerol phosphate synthase subunit HisF
MAAGQQFNINRKKMNLTRIIPRLDIKGPNVVKGLCFDGYRVLGHPETFAQTYYREGADELFFQDTVASLYKRNNLLEIVSRTAEKVMPPHTVMGNITFSAVLLTISSKLFRLYRLATVSWKNNSSAPSL